MSNDSLPKHPIRRTLFEEGKSAEENMRKIKRGLEKLEKILPPPEDDKNQATSKSPSSSPVKKK